MIIIGTAAQDMIQSVVKQFICVVCAMWHVDGVLYTYVCHDTEERICAISLREK